MGCSSLAEDCIIEGAQSEKQCPANPVGVLLLVDRLISVVCCLLCCCTASGAEACYSHTGSYPAQALHLESHNSADHQGRGPPTQF